MKHIIAATLISASFAATLAIAENTSVDLLAKGEQAWRSPGPGWNFANGMIVGATRVLDGAKTDPAASIFLVSESVFGGDIAVSLDISFEAGRYLGVYLDFDQDMQSGIWMATGHPLADDAADNDIERAYIKTVEQSFWVVRATGELNVRPNEDLHLRFERKGDYYSIYKDETLIVTYRKRGGYAAGPLQLRLTNARAGISKLAVTADWHR